MNAAARTDAAGPDAAGPGGARRQGAAVSDRPGFPPPIDTVAVIRPLSWGEAAPLDDVLAGLSPRSRYLRFHSPIPVLTPAMRRVLLDVDGRDHVAVAAETADAGTGDRVRAVGIARLIRDPQAVGEAEVAIAVVDTWHRRGVGRRLLEALTEQAWEIGVTRLHARVLSDNRAALGLIRTVFPARTARRDDDVVHLICVLDGVDDWEITMDDILADLTG
jgi:GNAT superfamily N-acetyltransferase